MNEKSMSDFLNYNIYLTRWKETEVRYTFANKHIHKKALNTPKIVYLLVFYRDNGTGRLFVFIL